MPTKFKFKLASILGALCFLGALIFNAPATLLAQALSQQKQQPFRLANAQGTIWQGQATLMIENEQQLALGQIAWQLHGLALFNQVLAANVIWNNQAPAQLRVSRQSINVDNLNITLPASIITYWLPSLNAVSLGGKLAVSSAHMQYANESFEGNANIEWQQASAAISKVNPLGYYILTITGQGLKSKSAELDLQLSTASGPLKLSGSGSWSPQSSLSFYGVASANDELEALRPLLHSIGNEEIANSGQFHFGL